MKQITVRRLTAMILGNGLMAAGIALFTLSGTGNNPYTSLDLILSERIGMSFSVLLVLTNALFFLLQLCFGRSLIGLGTVLNWFGVGFVITWFSDLYARVLGAPASLPAQLLAMAAGIGVVSLGVSLYQTADLGLAPYDSLAVMLSRRLPLPYFWCRIACDALCALGTWLLGGLIGVGTLVCALGLGPFVSFFDRHVSRAFCRHTLT